VTVTPEIIADAQASQRKWKVVPAAVSIAQYGIESGWGAHEPPGSNNPFGIKAVPGQPSVTVPTREFVGGRYITINAAFAAYPSVADAFDAHAELLATSHYYIAARAAVANGITEASTNAFAEALTGIYANAPGYGDSLIALMKAQNLYQYDTLNGIASGMTGTGTLAAQPVSAQVPSPAPPLASPVSSIPLGTGGVAQPSAAPPPSPWPMPPIPLTPSVPQLAPAFVPAAVAATGPTLSTVATPARVGAAVALSGLLTGATAMSQTHVASVKDLIDLAAVYLVAPIALGIIVGLATSLAKLLNINMQGALAQRVLTATENGAMALVSKAETAADDHSTITTKNQMIAGTLNYINAAVPDAVKSLGLATPAGQGILANLAEAKVQAAIATVTTPKATA
jgi:hypothetical protein